MASTLLCRVLCAALALAFVGAWVAPAPASAQVAANIDGTVTKRSDGSPLSGKTVTATCSYQLPPFSATFTATTDSNGNYSISASGDVSGSNCVVKVSPCPLSNPIQRTVTIPPSVSGVNFTCSS